MMDLHFNQRLAAGYHSDLADVRGCCRFGLCLYRNSRHLSLHQEPMTSKELKDILQSLKARGWQNCHRELPNALHRM